MAEDSRFWSGTAIGDAQDAPYDADTEFSLFASAVSTAVNFGGSGVIMGAQHGLQATVSGATVVIDTGHAIVNGTHYFNNGTVSVAIPVPAGANRQDLIVLRKSWAAQTVRVTRIPGVEGSGSYPSITQVQGTTWDCILFGLTAAVGGGITLAEMRSCIGPRPGDLILSMHALASPDAGRNPSQPTSFCAPDGRAISRTIYPVLNWLCAVDGYQYGSGDGVTTFNVLNMVGRVATQVDPGGAVLSAWHTVGFAGGEQTHLLLASESGMPTHTPTTASTGVGTLTVTPNGNLQALNAAASTGSTWQTGSALAHNLVAADFPLSGGPSVTMNAVNGVNAAGAHQNMQPTVALKYWLFVGGG